MPAYTLFANTGVQFIYSGLTVETQYRLQGWHHLDKQVAWIQYRTTSGDTGGELVFSVDTNTGKSCNLHFAESEQTIQRDAFRIDLSVFGINETIDITLRASLDGTGTEKKVAFVLDFGNCRSMGLLVEADHQSDFRLPARAFELIPHRLWWDNPSAGRGQSAGVFASRFALVSDAIPPIRVRQVRTEPPCYEDVKGTSLIDRLLGRRHRRLVRPACTVDEDVESDLFTDISPARLGEEPAIHQNQRAYIVAGFPTTGMSSPKRYLWSKDMEDSFWHQFVPECNCLEPAGGRFYEFMYEDDRDWQSLPFTDAHKPTAQPATPRYPRRAMMTACIYELLCQAYRQINSVEYRDSSPDSKRKRVLSEFVMTYPSGMSTHELMRYRKQVEKALRIFCHVHRLSGSNAPSLRMKLDEGSAGQLAYVYGELQAFSDAASWLRIVGRTNAQGKPSVRIASIDIGGGTSDLVIADYTDRVDGIGTDLACEIRHIDGASKAGDDIAEAVLNRILIPQFANAHGLSGSQVRQLFEDTNDGNSNGRKMFMSHVWVRLAYAYLNLANGNDRSEILLKNVVKGADTLNALRHSITATLGISVLVGFEDTPFTFSQDEFRQVLMDLFRPMLAGFCDAICRYDCDIVTLAGQPTSINALRQLIRDMLPLPVDRVVPLSRYETGLWYPLQDPKHPGRIADPKSVVVVGAAIEYLCSGSSGLGNLRVEVSQALDAPLSYFWGAMQPHHRTFRSAAAIFRPGDSLAQKQSMLLVAGREVILGRRLNARDDSEPTPAFSLNVKCDQAVGPVQATIRCFRDSDGHDELLDLVSVAGSVGVKSEDGTIVVVPAEIGRHVFLEPKGLLQSEYFLDSGVFCDIAYDKIRLQ